jgi:hypothetical protein
MRFLHPLILILTLLATPVRAEGLCDGKYALAEEMLDAAYSRYGSLYAGGHSYSWYDIGPTLDLWRLWRGLPDLRLREPSGFEPHSDWGADFSHFGQRPADIALLLRIVERPAATGLSPLYRHVTVRWLHELVYLNQRYPAGWWLDPLEPVKENDKTNWRARDTAIIAELLPKEPLLEWLLFVHDSTLSLGSAAWSREDRFPLHNFDRDPLSAAAIKTSYSNLWLEWFVVAALYDPSAVQARAYEMEIAINHCDATAADYAAHAVWLFQNLRVLRKKADLSKLALLPDRMRTRAIENLAAIAIDPSHQREPFDLKESRAILDDLAAWTEPSEFQIWLNAGRTWLATSVEDLIAIHQNLPMDGRAIRTLNVLSYDDLRDFAEGANLTSDDRLILINALAGRAFTLGWPDAARPHVEDLASLLPEHAEAINDALTGPGSDEVRLARALLMTPDPTVWMRSPDLYYRQDNPIQYRARSKERVDLPGEFWTGTFLTRDLRAYLIEPGSTGWMWGYRTNPTLRLQDQGIDYQGRAGVDFLTTGPAKRDEYGLTRLIAWSELSQLDVCHGLSKRLAEVIITWADEGTNGWFDHYFAPREEMADALRRVILMGRHNSGALVSGEPAGQVAMRLLQNRFGDSEAAKKTKYWYFEDHGCKP